MNSHWEGHIFPMFCVSHCNIIIPVEQSSETSSVLNMKMKHCERCGCEVAVILGVV